MHDGWERVMGAQLMLKQVLVFNVSTVLRKDLRRQRGESFITGGENTLIKAGRSEITMPSKVQEIWSILEKEWRC